MAKKILVLLGHPDKETFCGSLADAYEAGSKASGNEVRRVNIGELSFDPILHKGYKVIQKLEPDLVMVQEAIKWCDHLVIIYPSWWSTMPALFKGLIDRMWLPGFAYSFPEDGVGWIKLLKGKSSRVFVTMDSPPLIARIIAGDSTNEIKRGILKFSGFSPVKIAKIGPVKSFSTEKKSKWLTQAHEWGKLAL